MKKPLLLILLVIVSISTPAKDRAEKLRDNLFHNPKYVTIVAHRGDWRNHPENSIPGFQSCIEMGIDMIEIDIPNRTINVLLSDEELNARPQQPLKRKRVVSKALRAYAQSVASADKGGVRIIE